MKRTALYDEHVTAGARMVEFAGWAMPVQYQGVIAEHLAVRQAAGIFDVSHMGEVSIEGPRAIDLVERVFSNSARELEPGRAQYSLIPNEQGGLLDDVIVYRLAPESFFVCLNASNAERDVSWIRRHAPASGCTIVDRSDATALVAVQGPLAIGIVETLAPGVLGLPRFGIVERTLFGARALVARTGYTGEDGVEIFIEARAAVDLWRALLAAGASSGLAAAGLGARDTLRLEAALPLYGHELDEDVTPYEARVGWAVRLDRPQMVGFEALSRAKSDPRRRRTIGLLLDEGIARSGCAVLASGSRIGTVTSGSHCPSLGRAVALALVDGGVDAAEHAALAVDVRGKLRSARVTSLPFYVRQASGSGENGRGFVDGVSG
jgi:aminomethyltransferase